MRVVATGGECVPVTEWTESANYGLSWPAMLPDDSHFLFNLEGRIGKAVEGTYLGQVDRRTEARLILPGVVSTIYVPPDRLFFWRDGVLWAQSFHARELCVTGEPVQVADRVVGDSWLRFGLFSPSPAGVLTYLQGGSSQLTELLWVDRAGNQIQRAPR